MMIRLFDLINHLFYLVTLGIIKLKIANNPSRTKTNTKLNSQCDRQVNFPNF